MALLNVFFDVVHDPFSNVQVFGYRMNINDIGNIFHNVYLKKKTFYVPVILYFKYKVI